MKSAKTAAMITFAALTGIGIAACGGGSSSGDGGLGSLPKDTGSTSTTPTATETDKATPAEITGAVNLIVSWPPESISYDETLGTYRQSGAIIATDPDGNPVADGTIVSLNVIDRIIAQGEIKTADADKISGSSLFDAQPTDTNAQPVTFDIASITTEVGEENIAPKDTILLFNAYPEDRIRTIKEADGSVVSNTITPNQAYVNTYPDPKTYLENTRYMIGRAELGTRIFGTDKDKALLNGYAELYQGAATIYIEYPATTARIFTGCFGNPTDDTRYAPLGSAQVYMYAKVNDINIAVQPVCFAAVAGGSITIIESGLSPAAGAAPPSINIHATYRDGKAKILLPFMSMNVSAQTTKGTLKITVPATATTDKEGLATIKIDFADAASGDTGTITISSTDGQIKQTIDVAVP